MTQTIDKKAIAQQSAKLLLDTQSVLVNIDEHFTYTSGAKGPVYVDCRRPIAFAKERAQLMDFAAQMLSDLNFDYLAGGETAGIPYAAFLAQHMQKNMLYVRKKPKGFGRMAQIEGYFDPETKPNIMLIEDLQRDGGSKVPFVNVLRDAGATVTDSFVVFHYGTFPKSEERMKELGINLHALCTWWDILDVAKEQNYFEPAVIDQLELFLRDPDTWQARYAPAQGKA